MNNGRSKSWQALSEMFPIGCRLSPQQGQVCKEKIERAAQQNKITPAEYDNLTISLSCHVIHDPYTPK